ncbi:MAG: hypothetical protein QOF51_539 [Chloroflexota bacterium]|jgi:G3E family GTPase|nr:hypothetical protein [Chloroflexota bacterium]
MPHEPATDPRVPVTVLTGYLGSGKTTLLNRILTDLHGKRIAIVENEFGEIGIDSELVVGVQEEIVEMNNGCLCCTVRDDLVRGLARLMRQRDRFDAILIETSGLADPGPVAQTLLVDDELQTSIRLDAIVTLVDARHIWPHLEESAEARQQIAFADVVLLNKTDLVAAADVARLRVRIREMNGLAQIYETVQAELPLDKILDVGGFSIDHALAVDPDFLESALNHEDDADHDHEAEHEHEAGHEHEHDVASVGIRLDGDLDAAKLGPWLNELLTTRGDDIYRMKGIFSIAGSDARYVFQGVHSTFEGRPDRPWGAAPRTSSIVFIGRHLDRAELLAGLRACLV